MGLRPDRYGFDRNLGEAMIISEKPHGRGCTGRGPLGESASVVCKSNTIVQINSPTHPKSRNLFSILKFVAALGVLITLLMSASTHVIAEEEGRIQITFSKSDGSGSGYLFYQGQN